MKDLSTGKTYLTRRTRQIAGPVFARAGHNIDNLHGEREIMMAWANTLTGEEAGCLLAYLKAATADPTKGHRP